MTGLMALDHVRRTRIIAILRGEFLGRELQLAEALVDGGITAIEVSAVSPNFAGIIRKLQRALDQRAAIGVGTALKPAQLSAAADAGASFVVSPDINAGIVKETKRLGLASFPGAYTVTEILQAMDAGADAVKIFPAVSLGPAHIKAVRGPLPNARLVPTGGIDLTNLKAFLEAGSFAVGIGSELVGRDEIHAVDLSPLQTKARAFAEAARRATAYA